jgi:hypothetical protein
MKIYVEHKFLLTQFAVSRRFVESGVDTSAAERQVVHADVDLPAPGLSP